MSRRLLAYVGVTIAAALALLAAQVPPDLATLWPHAVAWIVICLVSETMWTASMTGEATVSHAAVAGLSVVVLWGPVAGMWIVALSTLVADLFVMRKAWFRGAFNAGAMALTSWLAGHAFELLGGRAALPHGAAGVTFVRASATALVVPFIALTLVYFVLNRAMTALAMAWASGRGWWRVLREDWLFLARLEVDAASFLLVPLMVIAFTTVGYPGVLLFYAPLFMLFQSDRRYFDLKKAEAENLRNARFAAKGELAAGIGHELNNQLVAIRGRAQMLIKDAEKGTFEKAPRNAQIILEQSERMAMLAKGLMDYTRKGVNVEPMDMNALLLATIEFVRGGKRFRGVEWETDLGAGLPQLQADVGQVQNVFINLFVNAADAMDGQESRRAIRVLTRAEDGGRAVRVEVADTGPGIKPEHLPRMFEFMFTTKEDGHGFGLSTSHRTIENHGGRFTVDSTPGEGARFTIRLPVRGAGGRA